ncbi:MAG: DUF503 domain-containing protein [bacterium]
MVIGVLQAKISIPASQSLKDKRSVIKGIKDRILNKMNVSVAEIDHQDVWKTTVMAFATIAAHKDVVEKRLTEVSEFLRSDPRYVLVDYMVEII